MSFTQHLVIVQRRLERQETSLKATLPCVLNSILSFQDVSLLNCPCSLCKESQLVQLKTGVVPLDVCTQLRIQSPQGTRCISAHEYNRAWGHERVTQVCEDTLGHECETTPVAQADLIWRYMMGDDAQLHLERFHNGWSLEHFIWVHDG